jgi:hypothetical protein
MVLAPTAGRPARVTRTGTGARSPLERVPGMLLLHRALSEIRHKSMAATIWSKFIGYGK